MVIEWVFDGGEGSAAVMVLSGWFGGRCLGGLGGDAWVVWGEMPGFISTTHRRRCAR